jgi:hypothetical protein
MYHYVNLARKQLDISIVERNPTNISMMIPNKVVQNP